MDLDSEVQLNLTSKDSPPFNRAIYLLFKISPRSLSAKENSMYEHTFHVVKMTFVWITLPHIWPQTNVSTPSTNKQRGKMTVSAYFLPITAMFLSHLDEIFGVVS